MCVTLGHIIYMLAQFSVFAVNVNLAAPADPYLICVGLLAVNRVCPQITS